MRNLRTIMLLGGMAFFGGTWLWLTGSNSEALDGLLDRLEAGEADGQTEAAGGPAVTEATRELADGVRRGMSGREVDAVLGQCSIARTERPPEGGTIRTAAWLKGDDLIAVSFRDDRVHAVVLKALPPLPPGEATPSGSPGPAGAAEGHEAASAGGGEEELPKDIGEAMQGLSERVQRRNEVIEQLMAEARRVNKGS